jgi:hypothetical protein
MESKQSTPVATKHNTVALIIWIREEELTSAASLSGLCIASIKNKTCIHDFRQPANTATPAPPDRCRGDIACAVNVFPSASPKRGQP